MKLLNVTQFSYNIQRREATCKRPFEIVIGFQPIIPNAIGSMYREKNLQLTSSLASGMNKQTSHVLISTKLKDEKLDGQKETSPQIQRKRPSDDQTHTPTAQDFLESAQGASKEIQKVFPHCSTCGQRLIPTSTSAKTQDSFSLPCESTQVVPSRKESRHALTAIVIAFDKDVECIIIDRIIRIRAYQLTTST